MGGRIRGKRPKGWGVGGRDRRGGGVGGVGGHSM